MFFAPGNYPIGDKGTVVIWVVVQPGCLGVLIRITKQTLCGMHKPIVTFAVFLNIIDRSLRYVVLSYIPANHSTIYKNA